MFVYIRPLLSTVAATIDSHQAVQMSGLGTLHTQDVPNLLPVSSGIAHSKV